MTMKRILLAALMLIGLISVCGAAPATGSVTGITASQVTFNSAGGASDCWFMWGGGANNLIYATTNDTSCSGTYTQTGSPLLTSYNYYVKACDLTGCGVAVPFTTSAATVSNRTHYGDGLVTIFKSGFNVTQSLPIVVSPYTNTLTAPVTWGLLFFFIFVGLWIRPKDITIPMMLAFIAGGAIWSGTSALGIPPEFADLGVGLMYAALAGLLFSWFTR